MRAHQYHDTYGKKFDLGLVTALTGFASILFVRAGNFVKNIQDSLAGSDSLPKLQLIRKSLLSVNLDNEKALLDSLRSTVSCISDIAMQLCRLYDEADLTAAKSNLNECLNTSM